MLERLLRPFDSANYVLIRTMSWDNVPGASSLPADVKTVPPTARSRWKPRIWIGIRELQLRARAIAEIVLAERCEAIVACTGGDLLDIPAAYRAARRLRVRYIAYYFDYWSQQSLASLERRAAEWIERRVLRGADAVIVPNEFLAEELHSRYGVRCTVVQNSCEAARDDRVAHHAPAAASTSRLIVYTGAVYEANIDAFRNLIDAIKSTGLDAKVHIFSAQTACDLASRGLLAPVEIHEHRPAYEVLDIQRKADVLFLPLGFQTGYPRIIRTSSPAKMCEYLRSGRPILVHAPRGSFVAEYFREHGCGVVVDEADPALLGEALRQLLEDEDLRLRVTSAACKQARTDYDLETARLAFARAVGLALS